MRHIGNLPDEIQARRFEDYLLTREIKAKVEPEQNGWAVWIFDEDHVGQSREELAAFRDDPQAERYLGAAETAREKRREEVRENAEYRKRRVNIQRKWHGPLVYRAPVTVTLMMISIFVVLATTNFATGKGWDVCNNYDSFLQYLFFQPIVVKQGHVVAVQEALPALKQGFVYRLVTPIFIHFTLPHIVFNMMWLRQLGAAIEARYGWWKFLLIVLFIAITSNTAQHLYNIYRDRIGLAGGMSGVVFGLFGFIWMKAKYDPKSGFQIPQRMVVLMIGWLFLCYTGWVGPIANAAHTVGLMAGMILGCWPGGRRS